jgi:hypothetical protein
MRPQPLRSTSFLIRYARITPTFKKYYFLGCDVMFIVRNLLRGNCCHIPQHRRVRHPAETKLCIEKGRAKTVLLFLKRESAAYSENSVNFCHTTRRQTPKKSNLQNYSCKNHATHFLPFDDVDLSA